jgi:predicted nucleotidyltransferase
MKKRKNTFLRPLDIVFSAPSHVAILRALKNVKEGFSGREVARRAGINHQTCADALVRLESRGVVLRLGAGKTQLFRLNLNSSLVRSVILPMLDAEQKQFSLMRAALGLIMNEKCVSGVLFGSTARGEETPESDFDIALIVEKKNQHLPEVVRALIQEGNEKWGIRVSPIILTCSEFIKRAAREDPLVMDILNEGIVLYGKTPQALMK